MADLEKIELINKSSLPLEEKKRLISQILGVKDKKKRELTATQRNASIERLELARQAKRDKAKDKQSAPALDQSPVFDNKKVEEIFEKKYNGEFSKLTCLLTDLNTNISEIKTMKKQKAEQKKQVEEEKLKQIKEPVAIATPEEQKTLVTKAISIGNKIAIPNYRNNFKK